MGVEAQPAGHPPVPLGHRVRARLSAEVRRRREHEPIATDLRVYGFRSLVAPLPMLDQHVDQLGVERHPTVLVGLGVLFPLIARDLSDAAAEDRHPGGKIEVGPPQATDLAATGAGGHREPHERSPVLVLPRLGQQLGRLGRRQRIRVRPGHRRRLDLVERVRRDPAPPDSPRERSTQDRMDDTNAPRRQRRTHMLATRAVAPTALSGRIVGDDLRALAPRRVLVADVLAICPVLHEPPSAAVIPASTHRAVQGLDRLDLHPDPRRAARSSAERASRSSRRSRRESFARHRARRANGPAARSPSPRSADSAAHRPGSAGASGLSASRSVSRRVARAATVSRSRISLPVS